jgi:ABC-type branched-subunit amino acid transport system substrate-binding protein
MAYRPTRRDALRATTMAGVSLALPQLLAGCSSSSATGSLTASGATGTAKDPVKVALVLPLGADAQTGAIGKALRQAAELAVFDLNQPGLQLMVKDDRGTEDGAKAAVSEAIAGGAEIILGPLFSRSTVAAAPVARQAGAPIISFSNDRTVAGNGVYLLSFLHDQEVSRIVDFAARQGRTRLVALLPKNALGDQLEQSVRAATARSGSTLVDLERYVLNTNAILAPARKIHEVIKAAPPEAPIDALFLPGGEDVLPMVAPFIPYLGIDTQQVRLLGTGGWDSPIVSREKTYAGGWFAAPDPRGWRTFAERFAKSYNTQPPRVASLAYDAVGVAAAFAGAARGSRYGAANLTRAQGFSGIDGRFRFSAGGLAERELAVLEVRREGNAVIDGAPAGSSPLYTSALAKS